MGHGASTSVKKVALIKELEEDPDESRPVWTRSNSDGCIVENLNSSKTKVDLLGQQVSEYKELLKASDSKQEEITERANTLEKQLAEVEGANFELTDTVSDLQQQLESLQANSGPEVNLQLEEELTLSNQQVEKLEMHVKVLEEQMATMRSKFRKKLKAANTELTEVKQESSLKLYSLKDQIKQLEEENLKLTERLDRANSRSNETVSAEKQDGCGDSRMMVILELSNQVSAQEDQIIQLQEQLEQKDRSIKDLTHQINQERPPSRPVSEIGGRPPSGASNRPLSGRSSSYSAKDHRTESSQHRKGSGRSVRSGESSEEVKEDEDIGEQSSDKSLSRYGDRTLSDTERTSSGRGNKEHDEDMHNHKRRHSSSRGRRKSGNQNERVNDAQSTGSLERTGSAESREGSQRRKRSSSRGKRKEASTVESLKNSSELHGNLNCSKKDLNDSETLPRDPLRIGSAGSQDSAFHESPEEGTKSAPSSAGTSRHRRRLKVAQQRASSLDTIDQSGLSSPKPPLRPDTNLYERDSAVGYDLDNVSSRSEKATNQELDDLLHEIMGDEDPHQKNNTKSSLGFGITEEKIRSLLSDRTT